MLLWLHHAHEVMVVLLWLHHVHEVMVVILWLHHVHEVTVVMLLTSVMARKNNVVLCCPTPGCHRAHCT